MIIVCEVNLGSVLGADKNAANKQVCDAHGCNSVHIEWRVTIH